MSIKEIKQTIENKTERKRLEDTKTKLKQRLKHESKTKEKQTELGFLGFSMHVHT